MKSDPSTAHRRVLVAGRGAHLAHFHPRFGDREQHVRVGAELLDDLDRHVHARQRRLGEGTVLESLGADADDHSAGEAPRPLRAAESRSRRS